MSCIPNELLVNILLRLPVRSLKRFSCVNKSWYDLIRSSYFISQHYSYHSSCNVKLLFKHENSISLLSDDGDSSHLSIPFPIDEYHGLHIIGPCINGIICLNNSRYGLYDNISLWNLATGEYKRVPKLQLSYPPHIEAHLRGLGFGWVAETNEYKLVMDVDFVCDSSNDHGFDSFEPYHRFPEVYVYNLTTNCWKQLSYEIPYGLLFIGSDPPCRSQIYVNGVCYWVNETTDRDDIYKIYSFHMRDEVFGHLQLPDFETDDLCFLWFTLSVLEGSIALIMNESYDIGLMIQVWVMEESWIKKFKIGPLSDIEVGLGFVKDEFFLEGKSGQLSSINSNSLEVKNLDIRGGGVKFTIQVLEYVESLVSINRPL